MGSYTKECCDLLSIYSVASDNNNATDQEGVGGLVVICFQFIL